MSLIHYNQQEALINIADEETSNTEPANKGLLAKETPNDHEPVAASTQADNNQATKTNPDGESASTQDKPAQKITCWLSKFCKQICLPFGIFVLGPIAALVLSMPVVPLLLAIILFLRLMQFFASRERLVQTIIYKIFIRFWLCLNLVLVLILMAIFYPIDKYITDIKHVQVIGLPIVDWVEITCMLSGLYMFSFFLSVVNITVMGCFDWPMWENGQGGEIFEAASEGMGCLVFWWAESLTITRVPAIKEHQVLGLRIHKWIEVFVFILLGYNIIKFAVYAIVWLLWMVYQRYLGLAKKKVAQTLSGLLCKKYMVFCVIAMRQSIILLLTSVLLLLMWLLHMGSHLKGKPQAESVFDFGTRTCVSILVFSLLWLIKSCILLVWEAHAVYTRLSHTLKETGKVFYFLVILSREVYPNITFDVGNPRQFINIKTLKDHLFNEDKDMECTLHDLYQVAHYFLEANNTFSNAGYTYDVIHQFDSSNGNESGDAGNTSVEKNLKQSFERSSAILLSEDIKQDWSQFIALLNAMTKSQSQDNTSEIFTMANIEKWVEGSRKSCLSLAKSLSSAKEVTNCLDIIISVLVLVAVFIMWLLLTGLATIQVLVLIGSPLLAATFIFGDTCKTTFQGIMFVYVLEPFSIGDLCVIDGEMMEVHSIGVRKTTFTKIDTHHGEVIYPNSELANKKIINHKSEFDWDEYLEYDVGCLDKDKIKKLEMDIDEYLKAEVDKIKPNSHTVSVMATKECIKVTVRFTYKNINLPTWTFFDCLQKKDRLRSEFAVHIKHLVDNLKDDTKENTG